MEARRTGVGRDLAGLLVAWLLAPWVAHGADNGLSALALPAWSLSGSNTFRVDGYNAYGNRAASPYPFTGVMTYDDLDLHLGREWTPFRRTDIQINGLLYNDSRYRSNFQGAVPERVNLHHEDGEAWLPWRLDAGDFYAYTSFRTMQRPLKGVQVELQPLGDWGGARQSLLLFSGGGSPAWRSFQLKDDWSNGASWLVEHPAWGRMAANVVFNHRKADAANGLLSRRQYVASLAYEKTGVLGGGWLAQRLTVEGEAGRFIGDHADLNGLGTGQNRQGNGFFAQVSGSPERLPALGYRARFEAYEQDYRPNGGNIQPDRRSAEGHLSWRFASGLTARARIQNFHTAWQTTNPVDTNVYGFNLSGPMWVEGLSGGLDAFEQIAKSRDLTTNTVTKSVNANLVQGVTERVSVRGGFFYLSARDRAGGGGTTITRQFSGGVDWRVEALGWEGTVSPGISYRVTRAQGSQPTRDINPTLNLNARRGPHAISVSWSALDQSRPTNDLGLVTRTAGLNYTYTRQAWIFGVEGNWYERNPDRATLARTDAWRLGAFLTLNFDRPARRFAATESGGGASAAGAAAQPAVERLALDISRLRPGMPVAEAERMLAGAGFGKPARQAGFLVWEGRFLRDIDQRQRLAVEVSGGQVRRVALVVAFDNVRDAPGSERQFRRVREELLRVYGAPALFFDQGDFTASLPEDLAAGRFIRVMQWHVRGGMLRFGIPRRTDGRVRMELQMARGFGGLKDTRWSMEAFQ